MLKKIMLLLPVLALMALPVLAADLNNDGLDDAREFPVPANYTKVDGAIAIDDVGTAVGDYTTRLQSLGYTVTAIAADSDLETLLDYALVILPVGHGDAGNYPPFDGLSLDYHTYVETGGGLWVGQPNPWQHPGNEATVTWVPYLLHVQNPYNNGDCPVAIVDDTHCITAGYPGADFSFPADTVDEMGPEWDVLVEGPLTGSPSVLVAEYGAGKILVEFGHPSLGSSCSFDDTAMRQYVECTLGGGSVATQSLSLDGVKALFK